MEFKMTDKSKVAIEAPGVDNEDESAMIAQRKEKLLALREKGNAFPNDFRRDSLAATLHDNFNEKATAFFDETPVSVACAGRIMFRRVMGKASFISVQDMSGKIQAYLRGDELPEGVYDDFKHWDMGDIVGVKGTLFKTKTGELSIRATELRLLTKALRPLPEKFHGLTDQETRYRQRYLDLIVNEKSRQTFLARTKTINAIRHFLNKREFLEVETPMMQPMAGGAAARPFVTKHNALDMQLFLRIAPELYLKRLVVGGFEKVFEINRSFRNEGISTRHNPEFTMLEFYWAYADFNDLMDMTEEMLREVAYVVTGSTSVETHGYTIDFDQAFNRMTIKEAVLKYNTDIVAADLEDIDKLSIIATGLGIDVKPGYGLGKIQVEIFEKTVELELIQPTFITAYPVEVSPLSRRSDNDGFLTDRFEFFAGGREVANGFSELNDPEDQAERFRAQVKEKEAGDAEAMSYDADYILALEHGMPPTAGEGIGIDRLVMLLTDSASIRDVILFPHMRAQA